MNSTPAFSKARVSAATVDGVRFESARFRLEALDGGERDRRSFRQIAREPTAGALLAARITSLVITVIDRNT